MPHGDGAAAVVRLLHCECQSLTSGLCQCSRDQHAPSRLHRQGPPMGSGYDEYICTQTERTLSEAVQPEVHSVAFTLGGLTCIVLGDGPNDITQHTM